MSESVPCLIWETAAEELPAGPRDGAYMDSPRAGGRYSVARSAAALRRYTTEHERARLTSWSVEGRRMGEEFPEVTTRVLDERADRLLRCIASELSDIAATLFLCDHVGAVVRQHRMTWSESVRREELVYLESYLLFQRWMYESKKGAIGRAPEYRVSVEGHARLAELDQAATDSSKVFVAMWFDNSMDGVWEHAIKPGIEDAGYEPVRIDRKEHVNKIDDEIIGELRRARFVVADFTHGEAGPRGGVYYEAGFAHGRNIPVIFSCRKDAIRKVHFDTRQYNHIVWEAGKLDEFRNRLTKRIGAVIGDGPRKK
jgi:hypothetical protein